MIKKIVSMLLVCIMLLLTVSCGGNIPVDENVEVDENENDNGPSDITGGWEDPDDQQKPNPDGTNPDDKDPDDKDPGDIEGGWGDPHTHIYVNGKCECGATDPNYNPHTHSYVDGKCECGATDPNYNPIPDPDIEPDIDPNPNNITVYMINRADWTTVSIYYWGNNGEMPGGWPGISLSRGTVGLYRAVFSNDYNRLIFNNRGGIQTADLNLPTDDKIVYDNLDNRWISFDEAIALLRSEGFEPHTHNFIEGKCECGEIDPNYNYNNCSHENYDQTVKYPTCTANGSTTYTCTECGYSYSTSTPATGHLNLETIPGKAATCGATGLTDGQKCIDCGTVTVKQTTIGATGKHNYVNAICTVCGMGEVEMDEELALFYALFDETSHVSLHLDISNSELAKMQRDFEQCYKSPIYRMADLIVTITTADGKTGTWKIPQVGVRMKGNTSRTNFYDSGRGMYNLIHFKISFQETFDDTTYYGNDALTWNDADARKARKNRTFATLEKIDMRWNRNDDTTYIRENYAYELYREFGVLAPHTSLASVDIGKDHAGVFVIYEPIDKIFLEKNLPAEALGGDLYKLGWTNEGATFTSFSSYGVEDELAGKFYVYDLKTNKKTSDHSSLKNLINTIKSSSVSKETFASLVEMESFINYCAVSYIIGNPDDLRNNYNNTYIYFRPDTGKMVIIPYDMDRGLGVNTWNPYGNGMTKDDPFSKTNVCGDQKNPLFLRTVCQGGMFLNEYKEALKQVDASELLTNARFEYSFNIAKNLYGNETTPSKTYDNAGWCKFRFDINRTCSASDSSNMSFADYMYAKRLTLYSKLGDLGNNEESGNSGNTGTQDPIQNCKPYIRGQHNNWEIRDSDMMKSNGDGTFTITITQSERIKIKLYDQNNNVWYGGEIIDPNCTVPYDDNNGNRNIYMDPGTYVLTFDANTVTLYIEKK